MKKTTEKKEHKKTLAEKKADNAVINDNGKPLMYYRCKRCLVSFATPEKVEECSCGGQDLKSMGMVHKDIRVTSKELTVCDARCTHADGPSCNCQCKGSNHGSGKVVQLSQFGGKARVKLVDEKAMKLAEEFESLKEEITSLKNKTISDLEEFAEKMHAEGSLSGVIKKIHRASNGMEPEILVHSKRMRDYGKFLGDMKNISSQQYSVESPEVLGLIAVATTDGAVLDKIIKHSEINPFQASRVFSNPELFSESADLLVSRYGEAVYNEATQSTKTSQSVLEKIYFDKNSQHNKTVSTNLAENPNTPEAVLIDIVKHGDYWTAVHAMNCGNVTPKMAKALTERPDLQSFLNSLASSSFMADRKAVVFGHLRSNGYGSILPLPTLSELEQTSKHVGAVGENLSKELRVVKVTSRRSKTGQGNYNVYSLVDGDGNVFTYMGDNPDLQENAVLSLSFKVRSHDDFNGSKTKIGDIIIVKKAA